MSHALLSRRNSSAFTLIELLTVIAIIGILAAIIIPTVSKVRHTARQTKCTAQLREWGRIIQLYSIENKGTYAVKNWASAVSGQGPYFDYFTKSQFESKRLRLCPANPSVEADLALDTAASVRPTYAMVRGSINGAISTLAPDTAVPLGRARNPSQYLLMMDSAPNDSVTTIVGNDLTGLTTYIQPLTNNTSTYVDRHGGRMINAVFGDGSVKRITYTPSAPSDPTAILSMRTTWFQLY